MSKGDSSDEKVFEVKNLIIHGREERAKQFGYGCSYYGSPYTNLWPNESAAHKADNPKPSTYLENLDIVLPPDTGSIDSQHFGGNPAFTMWLKVEEFKRSHDGTVTCTITKAQVRQFPMISSDSSYAYLIGSGSQPYTPKPPFGSLDNIRHPYDNYGPWFGWGCPFVIYAALYSGSTELATTTLFDFPSGQYSWEEGFRGISEPITLSGHAPNHEDPVTFVVYNMSTCSCNQGGLNRPVFSADITEYIPPAEPYIWRKFGTSKSNDPKGYEINPNKLDGKWHLVRPFFFTERGGSKKVWTNVEDEKEEE